MATRRRDRIRDELIRNVNNAKTDMYHSIHSSEPATNSISSRSKTALAKKQQAEMGALSKMDTTPYGSDAKAGATIPKKALTDQAGLKKSQNAVKKASITNRNAKNSETVKAVKTSIAKSASNSTLDKQLKKLGVK